jgi:acetyl-CoA carboxylase carboxyltransferase component
MTLISVAAHRPDAVEADVRRVGEREVAWFRLAGGDRHGAIGPEEGQTLAALIHKATDLGLPIVGVIDSGGADVFQGVASLHGWGLVAAALSRASGCVPILLAVTGACVSGPSLLLGLADLVVLTADARAYVSSPATVADITGHPIDPTDLGGSGVHAIRSGVAALVVDDEAAAVDALFHLLAFLPDNCLAEPARWATLDPVDRPTRAAAAAVPPEPTASYDMRVVIADVVDEGELVELHHRFASNLVTALATIGGQPVGIVANQPQTRAGTLDIEASQKGARFVQLCDAFNLPVVTFVDTPGFQPGRDIEWRGIIRHGAQLVHAYAAATVPRISVVIRKAYGGAYIVMDSKGLGGDHCLAWPQAEMAVMGAAGAVQILYGRRQLDAAQLDKLRQEYESDFCTPRVAAQRGFVDEVIDPADTRRAVAQALHVLRRKRESSPPRRHSNTPL